MKKFLIIFLFLAQSVFSYSGSAEWFRLTQVYEDRWQVDIDKPCQFKVQRLPEVRKGIMLLETVMRDWFTIDVKGREVTGVWTWFGIDPGDKVELDLNVYADGVPISLRSPHKPLSLDYEGWRWYPNYVKAPGPINRINIAVTANVTGHNKITPRPEGTDTARPSYGVWVLFRCNTVTVPPPPEPEEVNRK